MLGNVTRQKVCQAAGAQRNRRLLFLGALLLHQGNQLAGDEGEGDKDGRQDHARKCEDDLDAVGLEPAAQGTALAEEQHKDQAGDHRRDGKGHIDDRGEKASCRGN